MSSTVSHTIVVVFIFAHTSQNIFKNFFVIFFTVCTDKISFTHTTFSQNCPNTWWMVFCMNPVTNVFTITVKFWFDSWKNISNLTRNKFFDVLERSVVIWAVWNCCFKPKWTDPSTNNQIRSRFSWRVRAWWIVRCFVSKFFTFTFAMTWQIFTIRQITINFISRNMVET